MSRNRNNLTTDSGRSQRRFLFNEYEICRLGFDKFLFPMIEGEEYGERVFQDLFDEENTKPKEKGFIKYIYSRYKKWWGNRWKHRLVYPEGLFATFVVLAVSHLMKPATLHN